MAKYRIKPDNSGVYIMTNLINGHCYVGSTISFTQRWGDHKSELRHNRHHNPHIQRVWNKYGEQNCVFEILETINQNDLSLKEWDKVLRGHEEWWKKAIDPEYNLAPVAGSMLGWKHSEKTKAIIRAKRAKQMNVHIPPSKLFEYNGEWKSAKEWAKYFNVNYTSLRMKLRKGQSVEEAKNIKPSNLGLKEIAKKHNINYGTFWGRLKKGLSIEEALTKPAGEYKCR